jgi:hypothetical protein
VAWLSGATTASLTTGRERDEKDQALLILIWDRDGILAAIQLRISNGRLEGLNNKIGVLKHRAFGFHSAAALSVRGSLVQQRNTIAINRRTVRASFTKGLSLDLRAQESQASRCRAATPGPQT